MKWLNDLLGNKKQMRDIITGTIIAVPVLILIFYFGVLQNIEVTKLKLSLATISFAAIIIFVGNDRLKFNIRERAKEDVEDKDEETKALIKENDDIVFTREETTLGYRYAAKLSKDTQHRANIKYTETKIYKLEKKRRKLISRNASLDKVNVILEQIKALEETPLIPNWWNFAYHITPFEYGDIVSDYANMDNGETFEGGGSIKSRPIKRGKWIGAAGIGILFTEDFWTIIAIVFAFLFSATVTVIWQSWGTTRYMLGSHKQALKKKVKYKIDMRKYCDDIDNTKGEGLMFESTYDTNKIELVVKTEDTK
jgi:hypothetical protein